jgi:hypothetical protein
MKALRGCWRTVGPWTLVLVLALVASADAAEVAFPIQNHAAITDEAGQTRILVDFGDLSILTGKKIWYAKFTFEMEADTCSGPLNELEVEPVTRSWSPQTVDWFSPWDSAGGDFIRSGASVASPRPEQNSRFEVLLTPLVQAWADGRCTNSGLIVVPRFPGCSHKSTAPSGPDVPQPGILIVRYAENKP